MTQIKASDQRLHDLVALVKDLQARVKRLELQIGMRGVTFSTQATSVSGTSFEVAAWSVFPRSGSSLAVDVTVGGVLEVQLAVDGVAIGTKTSTAAGTITVSGFLAASWKFGDRKRVEVRARRTSGSGAVSVTVLGAWHR
ncbi:hypothetical protein AB0F17_43360 [Nonomuraea sp. NPDC026600]|uniref:hypothetical protein n=1 Tax=Nonomuraea sp. NPDC026600 TaxID=3155363 RepID=UPI0033E31B2D